jgi:hypothetical protein
MAIHRGETKAWFFTDELGRIIGISLTKVVVEDILEEKNLLVYAAATFRFTSINVWDGCFVALTKYAQSVGCHNVVVYTAVERIKRLMSRWGGNTKVSYIKVPIGG